MKIVSTFVSGLYAIQYENEEIDELERLLDAWNDVLFLNEFFEENKDFIEVEVEEAIRRTRESARVMEKMLQNGEWIDKFEPLYPSEYRSKSLSKQKSKKYWLRLYAIKIEEKIFLITGGAIKLTRTMQEHHCTEKELAKLTQCKDFLIQEGIFDSDSLIDFLAF